MEIRNSRMILVSTLALVALVNSQMDDFATLLEDSDYRVRLIDCIAGKKPCDSTMELIKSIVIKAVLNFCPDCTPFEEEQGKKIMRHLQAHHPLEFLAIFRRYIY